MAFVRLENVLPTLLLCAVITTRLKPSSSQRTTNTKFAVIPDHINVLKNETVEFICEQNAKNPFNIKYKGNIVIVENKQIKGEFLDIFDFQMLNPTTGKLTLNHATEEYTGLYKCGGDGGVDETYAVIDKVYTLISSKPICKSSIEIRPDIFEDQIDLIEMNCTSEDGVPHVTMSNHIIQGNKTTDVTSNSTKTTSSHPSKTLSLSSYFNSSFNNSVFVCNVSQQLPAPYNQSYQGSCSFGPILLLPVFSVAATPSEIIFSKVKNHIFKCTSNVSEVNLTWTNIPGHWKYDISEGEAYIELYVTDTGSDVCSVNIQCVGNYRNRNIASMIHISATNNQGTDVSCGDTNITSKMDNNDRNDSGRVKTVALVITAISLCLIFIIVIVVLYFRLNVSFCNRNQDLAKQNYSTNNANVRNTMITDDVVSSMGSQTENSALDVPAMIDNTIYETYTEKDCQNQTLPEIERLEKEQEIEMVENEIYESNSFSGYE